jgi:predicted Zn-dependent protease
MDQKWIDAKNGKDYLIINYKNENVNSTYFAYCQYNLMYIMRYRINNEQVYYLTLHELGHWLGAEHTSNGLMYQYYNSNEYACIDKLTADEVTKFNNWDINKVNYCIRYL